MELILGKRTYEKTSSGKYPKYNLHQMRLFVAPDCMAYTGLKVVTNVICYDLFGRYEDELTNQEKMILEIEKRKHYGLHNVDVDDLIDWGKFEYIDELGLGWKEFVEKKS